jgi:hypothetical protein
MASAKLDAAGKECGQTGPCIAAFIPAISWCPTVLALADKFSPQRRLYWLAFGRAVSRLPPRSHRDFDGQIARFTSQNEEYKVLPDVVAALAVWRDA